MSLTQGVETFSEAQILRVLEDLKETDDKSNPRTYIPGFLVNVLSPHLPPEKVSSDIEAYSTVLYNAAADPERHLHRLDKAIALIAKCNFRSEESDHVLVQRASQILSRLPARPPLLLAKAWPDGAPDNFPEEYTFPIPCHKSIVDPGPITRWNHLKVVAHVNTAVIRLALHVACSSYDVANITSLLNLYVELLERTSAYSGRAETPRTARYWYVVRAALWTTWQRSMMIFSYQVLQLQIKEGYVDERESLNNSRRMSLATEISVDLVLQKSIENLKENYMCNWAYRLVLNGYISNGLDLRRFHERFRTLYHCRPGRCNATLSCDGKSPESCGRFKGALIIDQSAHNISCSRICGTLYWDESSYRNIRGARAVDIKQTDSQFLRYCEATDETLSISHVWSHGQGGRPESGFNQCLHDRYTSLAKVLNCKSYWMDTPCIPEDHELREEAIANINEVFTKSKATLICDKDLMEIDVSFYGLQTLDFPNRPVVQSSYAVCTLTLGL
ncbi:hypothetical protein MMC14_008192 [Varicellaria rhodocarpa]|nr:hypothetical protein [Varicellaria rhodocarpa]